MARWLWVLLLPCFLASCQDAGPDGIGSDPGGRSQLTVAVSGMFCPTGCAPRVQEALRTLPWVKQVEVDFNRKQATVIVEPDRVDEAALIRVLEQEGFGGKILK